MRIPRWTTMLPRALALASFLLLALATAGWAATLRGQVVDAQTGQPIAGAVVLGVWTKVGGLPGLHHTDLVGVRETETDASGHFALERLKGSGEDAESLTVYKFGYVAWNNLFVFPTWERRTDAQVPAQIPLERFAPGDSHQKHMSFISNATRAGMFGHESDPKFQKALDREMRMR